MISALEVLIIGPRGEPSVHELSHNPKYSDNSIGWRRQMLALDGYKFSPMQCLSYLINQGKGEGADLYYTGFECLQPSIAYLTSFLRARGISTAYINNYNGQLLELNKIITNERPSVAAITTTFTFSAIELAEQVRYVKERSPETIVVIGGPFVWTLCRGRANSIQEFMSGIGADYYIQDGQGELSLSRLTKAVCSGGMPEEVPNVWSYDKLSKIWVCKHRAVETNSMNDNAIDWSLFSDQELGNSVFVRTARGCAYRCSFCEYPIRQPDYQQMDEQRVSKELDTLAKRGVKYIQFVDDTFNIPKGRWINILKNMTDNEWGFQWMSFFRSAQLQKLEHYELMANSGCRGVLLGVESADNDVLKIMNKGATKEQYAIGIRMLQQTGIRTNALIIIGHPGEDFFKARQTMDFILNSGVTYLDAQVYFHSQHAPISSRSSEFEINEGEYGYITHNKMSSETANILVDELFHAALDSNINWCMNFDEWDFGYLMGKGMSYAQIHKFSRCVHEIRSMQLKGMRQQTSKQLPMSSLDHKIKSLREHVQSLTLEPARYSLGLDIK